MTCSASQVAVSWVGTRKEETMWCRCTVHLMRTEDLSILYSLLEVLLVANLYVIIRGSTRFSQQSSHMNRLVHSKEELKKIFFFHAWRSALCTVHHLVNCPTFDSIKVLFGITVSVNLRQASRPSLAKDRLQRFLKTRKACTQLALCRRTVAPTMMVKRWRRYGKEKYFPSRYAAACTFVWNFSWCLPELVLWVHPNWKTVWQFENKL